MVGAARDDTQGAVKLLAEEHASQLMGEGEAS